MIFFGCWFLQHFFALGPPFHTKKSNICVGQLADFKCINLVLKYSYHFRNIHAPLGWVSRNPIIWLTKASHQNSSAIKLGKSPQELYKTFSKLWMGNKERGEVGWNFVSTFPNLNPTFFRVKQSKKLYYLSIIKPV